LNIQKKTRTYQIHGEKQVNRRSMINLQL